MPDVFVARQILYAAILMKHDVLAFVLAGGRGTRLGSLTTLRAKSAMPFGGKYRIIDFVLSNLVNSGVCSIYVLVQANSHSLLRHLRDGWQFGGVLQDQFVVPVAAQMRAADEPGYRGTADAIFQNVGLIDRSTRLLVAVFGGDHIYRMNIRAMLDEHERRDAQVTVAAYPVDAGLAAEFGVIEAQPDGLIVGFHEKQPDAPRMPGQPERVYASMGNYIFNAETLLQALETDSSNLSSRHDFGHDILPSLMGKSRMYAYEFRANAIPGETAADAAYWRDVGTVDAYYDAHMDLCGVAPSLNLYNRRWPIRTASYPDPAAKFTFDREGQPGQALGSIVSGGCILSGGLVRNSVLGRGVFVDSGAVVENSIVFDNCRVGRGARVRQAIIDENTLISNYEEIGNAVAGQSATYEVSPGGVVVVTRQQVGA